MRKKNTESLADVIRQVLKANRLEKPLYEKRIIDAWGVVLGGNILQYTGQMYIRNRILYVQLTSSVLRYDLFLTREEIKNALNKHVGAEVIDDIVLK